MIAYSHMEAPVGTHLFWTCLLRDCSFPGERRRLDEVANFIVENEFYNLQSLEGSDHPNEWAGSDKLSSEELSELWDICRYVAITLCVTCPYHAAHSDVLQEREASEAATASAFMWRSR